MITKDQILSSIKYVVDNSKYVHINEDNINKAINLLNTSENKKQSWLDSNNLDIKTLTQKEIIISAFLCLQAIGKNNNMTPITRTTFFIISFC